MTAASTILGVLPIALALGAGAESRTPMGVAIIGGLLVGTVLTLFVIPSIYPYLTKKELSLGEVEAAIAGDGRTDAPPALPEPRPATV
jgi:multidrug efflux pump